MSDKNWIVIVEDDSDTLDLLVQQLSIPSYNISTARNGQEAILVTGEGLPGLVIMDIMMPLLDGFETIRYFKEKFKGFNLPILVVTAKGDRKTKQQASQLGCEYYLGKPYSRSTLLDSVAELIELGRLENQLIGHDLPSSNRWVQALGGKDTFLPRETLLLEIEKIRLKLSERLIDTNVLQLARVHLDRVLERNKGCERAKQLKIQLD